MIKLKSVYKSLNIEEKEVLPVLLLITQSIFIGVFYGAYDIGAHTLFLNVFPEDMIPKAYIISGIVGIGLTSLFSKIQTKISFSRLASFSLLFISVLILLMRSMFAFLSIKSVVFIVFIFFGPLNIIAILAFWGTVGRIFNLRQGKRLFGIIDTGQIIGIIISSFAIPLLISYLKGINNILLISAASIFLAMLIELVIAKKFKFSSSDDTEENKDKEDIVAKEDQVALKDFAKNPYILYMALFVVFSMFAAFFVQYSFLVVAKEKYPIEEDMATYLGFFTGSMMIFTLIIKTFVYSKLVKTYGLKVSLILSPVLLGLFTLIAIAAGYFSGFTESSAGFIYFFLLISLSKLFNKTLKDALELPSFKLLYQALAKKIRFDVQAKIDGTINEIAALVSGLFLYVLGAIAFIQLIHFSIVLLVLLVLWTFITIRLYKEYRNNLEKSLKESKLDDDMNIEIVVNKFKKENSNVKSLDKFVSIVRESLPLSFLDNVKFYINDVGNLSSIKDNKFDLIEAYFLNRRGELKFSDELFESIKVGTTKQQPKDLINLLGDVTPASYLLGIEYTMSLNEKERMVMLTSLLRTPIVEVQQIAIRICGEVKDQESCGTLVEFLSTQVFYSLALISLKQLANDCYKQLIQMFYKTDISISTQLAIIKLLGQVKNEESKSFLLENLSHHQTLIFQQSIQSLSEIGFLADEKELPRLFHPITQVIQTLAWDISAMASIDVVEEAKLFKAVEFEFKRHKDLFFKLLSIAYEPKSVNHVRDYFNSDNVEDIGYALELFDIFISDEIKPIVLLIFEEMSLVDKTRLLQDHFPVEVMKPDELVLNILNRDPNLISLSTKRIALDIYTKYHTKVSDDIIAQLFSPIIELQLNASEVINKLSPSELTNLLPRIDSKRSVAVEAHVKDSHLHSKENEQVSMVLQQIANAMSSLEINPVDIADYLCVTLINDKFVKLDKLINEYFVFLIIDHDNLLDNDHLIISGKQLIFTSSIDAGELKELLTSNSIVVGIKRTQLIDLQLINDDFIKNLISLS